MKFKPGDRVICINAKNLYLIEDGDVYKVEQVFDFGMISIRLSDNYLINYTADRFVLESVYNSDLYKALT